MVKLKRKVAALLSMFALCMLSNVAAAIAPEVDPNVKIYDFADILSNSQEERLSKKAVELYGAHNAHFVVVTCEGNTKNTLVKYADKFYDNFLEAGDTPDCVMLTIDMSIRQVRVDAFGRARVIISDQGAMKIVDSLAPMLTSENYEEACIVFMDIAAGYLKSAVWKYAVQGLAIGAVISLIAVLIMGILHNRRARKSVSDVSEYVDYGSFWLGYSRDIYITSRITKTARSQDNDSSGSGGGGGGASFGGGDRSSGAQRGF